MKKKQMVLVIMIMVLTVIAVTGVSLAVFSKTLAGTKKVSIKTGTLSINFTEGNFINVNNQAPISDTNGLKTTPYTFTIKNNGNIKAYYTISLEEDSGNTLPNTLMKYQITGDNGYTSGVKTVGDLGSGTVRLIPEQELAPSATIQYTLHMWLSSTATNSAQGKTYQSKIVVTSRSNPS